jgi:O-antigen/teichoic acid export membrane protein
MVRRMRAGDRAGTERPSFFSAAASTYATNVAVAVLSLVNVVIVARTLGPTGRGGVAFLTAIAWFTSNMATFGIQEANANLAGAEPGSRRSLATNSVLLALFFGLGAAVFLVALIAVFPGVAGDSPSNLLWLTFASLPVLVLGIYMRFLVQADYGFGITNLAWLITPVANVSMNGVLAVVGLLSVGTAVATWIAGQTMATILLLAYVGSRMAGFGSPDWGLLKRALAFGVQSHAGRAMLLGNYRLDQWLLGAISGSRQLGLYSVAVAWAEALWFLPTTLSAVQRPDLVRAAKREAGRRAAFIFRSAVVVSVLSGAAMLLLAPFLCIMVFGEDFRDSILYLRILVLGVFGVVALKLLGNALTAQRRPVLASGAIGAGFAATIVLDVILIPPYGALGAAVASSLAYTAGGVAIAVIFCRALDTPLAELVPRRGEFSLYRRTIATRLRRSRVAADAAARSGPVDDGEIG